MNFAQRAFEQIVAFYRPTVAVDISVDGWFGNKWLGFSGKTLGAVGISKLRLTIPPFVPNRILSEIYYKCSDHEISSFTPAQQLHGTRTSEQNLNLYLDTLFDDALLFWHGSSSDRIPCMIYRITPESSFAWYMSILEKSNKIDFVQGVSKSEAESILQFNVAEQDAAANP